MRDEFIRELEASIEAKERISFEEVNKKTWFVITPYSVNFTPQALDDMLRLDKNVAQLIVSKIEWLSQNIENIIAYPLRGKFKDKYKLKVADWILT